MIEISTWTDLECRWDLVCAHDPFFQHLFVVLSPFSHGQLGDFDCRVVNFLEDTGASELVLSNSLNGPLQSTAGVNTRCLTPMGSDSDLESPIPRRHRFNGLSLHPPAEIVHNIRWAVVGNIGTPTSTNTISSVDED
jgi:hypothetical protein